MISVRRRTFGITGRRLCGQLDANATYLCGFGEVEDQDSPDNRWRRKFVVCPTPPGKINILEIDDRLGQANGQSALVLLFAFLRHVGHVAQRGRDSRGEGGVRKSGIVNTEGRPKQSI